MSLVLIMAIPQLLSGQVKHDANWVFGKNVGLSFKDDTLNQFLPNCDNREIASSISDRDGNLLLYLADTSLNTEFSFDLCLKDKSNNVLFNGGDIRTYSSCSNGAVILPLDNEDKKFMLVYQGDINKGVGCPQFSCNKLMYAVINREHDTLRVLKKNIEVTSRWTDERVLAIRHANGKDWWIVTHELSVQNFINSNKYLVFGTKGDSLFFQNEIALGQGYYRSAFGWSVANLTGNKLVVLFNNGPEAKMDVLNFDRCNGHILFVESITLMLNTLGCSFSQTGKYIYLSTLKSSRNIISRYDATALPIANSQEFIDTINTTVSRLALSPFGNIHGSAGSANKITIIENPDSQLFKVSVTDTFQLLDSSQYSDFSMPNFPNYNLGATTIFQADAGKDTFYCAGDTSFKVLTIGQVDTIPGVTYTWLNEVDSNQRDQPYALVKPETSTWYYLELTDTSIQGSCTSRMDSVLVEVRNCTGITENEPLAFKLYPNPTRSHITIEWPHLQPGDFTLYDLLGKQEVAQSINKTVNHIDLSNLSSGIYLYTISDNEGHATSGKLIIH